MRDGPVSYGAPCGQQQRKKTKKTNKGVESVIGGQVVCSAGSR